MMPEPYHATLDGRARLYRGDAVQLLPLIDAGTVDAIVSDPPYSSGGLFRGDRAAKTRTKYTRSDTASPRPEFLGDTRDARGYLIWSTLWLTAAYHAAAKHALAAVFADWRQLPTTTDALQSAGWTWRGIFVWTKPTSSARPQPNRYRSQAEFIVWGTKGQGPQAAPPRYAAGHWHGEPTDAERSIHPAIKPAMLLWELLRVLPDNSLILDPFAGTGSTGLAALAAGHRWIGFELCPLIAETARGRLQPLLFNQPATTTERTTQCTT